jgi:hypothetical protein
MNLRKAAVSFCLFDPSVNECFEISVALQPIGLLGAVERLFRMDGAKHARMKLLLILRLRGIRDHQISVAAGNFVEDADVIGVGLDFGVPDVGAREPLIGTAGIDDDAGARPVDIGKRLVFAFVPA